MRCENPKVLQNSGNAGLTFFLGSTHGKLLVWDGGLDSCDLLCERDCYKFLGGILKKKQFLKTQSSPSHVTIYNYAGSTNFPIGIQPD